MTKTRRSGESLAGRAAAPTAYPPPGQFSVTQRITLLCPTPGARIYYTTDGAQPDTSSRLFNPYKLILLEALSDGDKGLTTSYTIRAIAVKNGMIDSDAASFAYTMKRRDRDVYISAVIQPGVHMISDFDDTKMFLVMGSARALLIDAGLGSGDLRGYVQSLTGGLPVDVAITHAHPDHIALMGQFQADHDVYMHPADLPLVRNFIERLGYRIDPARIKDIREGYSFDLGGRKLTVYEVPGHTPGCIVLFDEANGILFGGDAVGSNRPTIVDSLWLQRKEMARVDEYLSALRVFRPKVRGKIRLIYTGHNDTALIGEAYHDNLQQAAQKLVDEGAGILTPSLRPEDVWQVVVGDRLADPNWAAINVMPETCLTAPPEAIATLSNIELDSAGLSPRFAPNRFSYMAAIANGVGVVRITATATSSRYRQLTINGNAVKSGQAFDANLPLGDSRFEIRITSPDGQTTNAYVLMVNRKS